MKATLRCELVSWNNFHRLARRLALKIRESGFKPDLIVAIGRGGYLPARILSDFLNIMNLASFKIEHYRGLHKKRTAQVRYPIAHNIEGRSVLLVDDVCDTGDTFTVATKHLLERMGPVVIRTAVLHYKKESSFIPDYYAKKIVKWRWIVYPWAVVEDVSQILKSMHPLPDTLKGIHLRLEEEHAIRISNQTLSDILTCLDYP